MLLNNTVCCSQSKSTFSTFSCFVPVLHLPFILVNIKMASCFLCLWEAFPFFKDGLKFHFLLKVFLPALIPLSRGFLRHFHLCLFAFSMRAQPYVLYLCTTHPVSTRNNYCFNEQTEEALGISLVGREKKMEGN